MQNIFLSLQIVCGDLLCVSQPAASNIVANVSRLIALRQRQYIKYPQDMVSHRAQFAQLGRYQEYPGLRNVDGAIDCTHVKIVNTPGVEHHEAFRNRKSYFSINVQVSKIIFELLFSFKIGMYPKNINLLSYFNFRQLLDHLEILWTLWHDGLAVHTIAEFSKCVCCAPNTCSNNTLAISLETVATHA